MNNSLVKEALSAVAALFAACSLSYAANGTWTAVVNGAWSDTTKWASGTIANGQDAIATINVNIAAARTITMDTRTLGTLSVNDTGSTYYGLTISGGSILFDVSTGNAAINRPTAANTAIDTIASTITLNTNLDVNLTSAGGLLLSGGISSATSGLKTIANKGTGTGTLRINGSVSDGSGAVGITQSGVRSLVVVSNAANAYSGDTTVSAGVLRSLIAALPSTSLLTINGSSSTAIWENATAGTFSRTVGQSAGNVYVPGGTSGFSANGGALTIQLNGGTGPVQWTGDFSPATLVLNAATANRLLDFQNPLDLTSATPRTIWVDAAGVTATSKLSGAVSNSDPSPGGLTKAGAGVLVLAADNTYGGPTVVDRGMLTLGSADALPGGIGVSGGASVLTLNGGVIGLGSGDFLRDLGTDTNQVQWTGSGGFAAVGSDRIVNLGGASAGVTWGSGSFCGGTLILGSIFADRTVGFQNPINLDNAARTIQVDNGSAALDAVVSDVISSSGSSGGMTKTGVGTLALGGLNTYAGPTTLGGGTLRVGVLADGGTASSIGQSGSAAANLVVSGSATLQYTGATVTVNRDYTINASQTLTVEVTDPAVTLELTGTNAVTTGALTKSGTGTLKLSAANGFTGLATVSAGTLQYGSHNALNTGGLTVNGATAVLDMGTYTDGVGAVTLTAGSIIGSGPLGGSSYALSPASGSHTCAVVLVGSGTLTKSGVGTACLTATNSTYTGKTAVSAGVLEIQTLANYTGGSNPSSLGAPTTVANATIGLGLTTGAGTLRYAGPTASSSDRPIALAGTTGGAVLDLAGTGSLTLSGTFTSGSGSKTLTLTGTNTTGTGTIQSVIVNTNAALRTFLTKTGASTWVLTGPSTYTGSNTVNGGVLSVSTLANGGVASSIGQSDNGSTNLVFGGGVLRYTGGSVTIDRAFRLTQATISGIDVSEAGTTLALPGATSTASTGGFNKLGAGRLTLSGANTYTGPTIVSNGTLRITGSLSSGPVTVADGLLDNAGTIGGAITVLGGTNLGAGITGTVTVAGGVLAPGAEGSAGSAVSVGKLAVAGGALAFEFDSTPANDTIVVTNGLTLNGGGVYLYNETDHSAWAADGVYNLVQYTGAIAGTGGVASLSVLNPAADKTYAFGAAGGWVSVTVSSTNLTWDGGGDDDDWDATPANWDPDGTPAEYATLTFAGSTRLTPNNNFAAGTRFGGIVFSDSPATAGSFTLGGNSLNLVGNIANASAADQAVSLPLVLEAGDRVLDAAAGNLTVGGAIGEASAGLGIVKTGSGTLTLTNANTYSGSTRVASGALNVRNADALGATAGATVVTNGAALQLQNSITMAAEPLTLYGTGVASDGALVNVQDPNTYAGTITVGSDTRIAAANGTLTLDTASGAAITGFTGGVNYTLTLAGAGDIVVADQIATGILAKVGAGTVTLAASNLFTGAATISEGILSISHRAALGSTANGTIVTNTGSLELQGGITTMAEPLSLNGYGPDGVAGALRNLSDVNTYSGAVTLVSDSFIRSEILCRGMIDR